MSSGEATSPGLKLIIDAHLDLAWNALSFNRDLVLSVPELRRREAHMTDHPSRGRVTTSLPEMRRAGVAVCVATILARSGRDQKPQAAYLRTDLEHASPSIANAAGHGQLAYYRLLEEEGWIRPIRTGPELDAHWRAWLSTILPGSTTLRPETSTIDGADGGEPSPPIGMILSMEGADPIVHPGQAAAWWDVGLRALGLSHYGKGQYSVGTGDSGPLTPAGLDLLREMERLGLILDATHLSDPSFFQALDAFGGPVLASHNNCRALVPGDRQFSDEQIEILIERDAVIGAVLDAWMLHPGWEKGRTSPEVLGLEAVADHIDHICQLAGSSRHAAIGSDLDGGFGIEQTPGDLDTIADLQKLEGILRRRGYADADIDLIFHGNWLRFFGRALPRS